MNYSMLYTLKMLIGLSADECALCLNLLEDLEETGRKIDMPQCGRFCTAAAERLSWYGKQLALMAGEEVPVTPGEEEVTKLSTQFKGLAALDEKDRKATIEALCLASRKGWSALGAMEQLSAVTGQERWDLILAALPTLKEEVTASRELRTVAGAVVKTAKEITGKTSPVEITAALTALHSNGQRDAPIVSTARELCGGAVETEAVVARLKQLAQDATKLEETTLQAIINEGLGRAPGADGKLSIKIVEAQIPLMKKLGVEGARAWLDASPPLKIGSDLTPAPIPPTMLPQPAPQGGQGTGTGTTSKPTMPPTTLVPQAAVSLPPGVTLPEGVSADVLSELVSRYGVSPEQVLKNLAAGSNNV